MNPFYQAELTCSRCGAKRYVPAMAVKFTYWVCLPLKRCGRINIWK
jgi:hypothetical protein